MKRSYEHSFVQDSGSTTTIQHSFRRRPATLATQPFYDREDYVLTTAPGFYYQGSQTNPYLLTNYQDIDPDFQSNAWRHSLVANPSDWRNELRLSIPERRLTGLGILLEPSGSSPANTQATRVDVPFDSQTTQDEVMHTDPPDGNAYSECPGADFMAHSPARSVDFAAYWLPSDEFLMLIDSPLAVETKMDVDSPTALASTTLGGQRFTGSLDMSSAFDSPNTGHIGIIPDINYRSLATHRQPTACVNPADISGPGPGVVKPKQEETDMAVVADIEEVVLQLSNSPPLDTGCKAEFPDEAVSAIVSLLAASNQEQGTTSAVDGTSFMMPFIRQRQYIPHPHTSVQLPAFASRSTGGPSTTAMQTSDPLAAIRSPLATIPPNVQILSAPMPARQLSPVLNAHEGVPLEDLRRRAEAFRALNPGFDLDKTFLQAFAGRLSERGELISDFRCYVKGCSQSNKRRDHILVHVGSHVEHRPFKCDQWCVARSTV